MPTKKPANPSPKENEAPVAYADPSQGQLAATVAKTQKGKVAFTTKATDASSIHANGKEYAPSWYAGVATYTVNEEDADAFSKHTHVAHGKIARAE